jgi:O-antigen/teichoic acid export membrane protein
MSKASSSHNSSRSALGIFGTLTGLYPLKILVSFYVIHVLGPHEYGAYTFFMLASGTFLPLLCFGFGSGITYAVSSGSQPVKEVVVSSLLVGFMHGLLNAMLIGALWYYGLEVARGIPLTIMLPVLIIMPIQGITLMMYRTLMGGSWFSDINRYFATQALAPPAFLLVFVILLDWGLMGAAISIVGSAIVLFVFTVWIVWRRAHPVWSINTEFLREGYHFGFREWIGGLSNYANLRLDQVFLSNFPPEVLGIYGAATRITELLWLAPDSVGPVLFNRIAGETDLKTRAGLTAQIHRVMFGLVVLLGIGLAATAWLVPLVLPEYVGIEDLIWLLIPGTIAVVTTKVLTKFLSGSGFPERSSMAQTVGAVITIAGAAVLIPWLGVQGAAITSSLAYTAAALSAAWLFHRTSGDERYRLFALRLADTRWMKEQVRRGLGARG